MNPLDQLADITIPNEVSVWPLAWGWWLVIGLFLITITWAILWIIKRKKLTRSKRHALAVLPNFDKQSPYYVHQVQVLLKQLCSEYVPTNDSAPLHGEQWQNIIMSVYSGPKQNELKTALDAIFKGMYMRQTTSSLQDNEQIETALMLWVKTSLPVSQSRLLQVAGMTKKNHHKTVDKTVNTTPNEVTNV